MSSTHSNALDWRGRDAVDRDGDKIGQIEEIYLDATSGQPEWLAVKTGLFGGKQTFVPSVDARPDGDVVRVPFEKALVKDAPNMEADGRLSPAEEETLYVHYGLKYDATDTGSGDGTDTRDASGTTARDTSGPETDDAMTRSEEELRVGKAEHESGRVRLRKHIVTEQVQTTVPVSREEVRVEREPITDGNADAATSGKDLSEEEVEMTLNAEEVVTEKRVVPKERVRLEKDTITEEQGVSEEIRKERIESDGDVEGGPRR